MSQRNRYEAAPALAFLAAPAMGRSSDEVANALACACSSGSPAIQLGVRLPGRLRKARPGGSGELPLRDSPHAAILLSRGPSDAQRLTLGAVLARAGTCLDLEASALLVGTEHVVRPGAGSILVAMLTTRRDDFTRHAYFDRWLTGHAPFGLRIDAAGYRQIHADAPPDPGAGSGIVGAPPANLYDGIGMVTFRDLEHVSRSRAAPEIAMDATTDEMAFIDHSRSMLMMFRLLD
jgi:hypothetical protein